MNLYLILWEAERLGMRGGITRRGYSVTDVLSGLMSPLDARFPEGVPIKDLTSLAVRELVRDELPD